LKQSLISSQKQRKIRRYKKGTTMRRVGRRKKRNKGNDER